MDSDQEIVSMMKKKRILSLSYSQVGSLHSALELNNLRNKIKERETRERKNHKNE
jgi:hypothetical protein